MFTSIEEGLRLDVGVAALLPKIVTVNAMQKVVFAKIVFDGFRGG
jgi:hypothetical protein